MRAKEHNTDKILTNFMKKGASTTVLQNRFALRQITKNGLVYSENGYLILSSKGIERADQLLKGHRLWETFLATEAGVKRDHTHDAADRMEHYLDVELQQKIKKELGGK